jgi:NTE family protein
MAAGKDQLSSPPELLVLGGGGVLGEVWMNAVLAGLEEAGGFDARASGAFVGTSAGSIVAAALAGGVHPRTRLDRLVAVPQPGEAEIGGPASPLGEVLGLLTAGATAAASPLGALALRLTAPAGAPLRRALLARVPPGRRSLDQLGRAIERLGVGWDARLHVVAVELASGRRVVFGGRQESRLSVSEAVQASCAIPGLFRPLRSGGHEYVDGGVWSPTNMDATPVERGASVLCLNPTGSMRASPRSRAWALGAVSRSIAAAEAFALRVSGARVRVVSPDDASRAAMGQDLLDRRPSANVLAAGLRQGMRLTEKI